MRMEAYTSLRVSHLLSLDLPLHKELVAVPTFNQRDMLPGEAQPTPMGNPGEYEVTFIFTRPELSMTEIRGSDLDYINGDSALVIAELNDVAKANHQECAWILHTSPGTTRQRNVRSCCDQISTED